MLALLVVLLTCGSTPPTRLFGLGQRKRYSPSPTQRTILAFLNLPIPSGGRAAQVDGFVVPASKPVHAWQKRIDRIDSDAADHFPIILLCRRSRTGVRLAINLIRKHATRSSLPRLLDEDVTVIGGLTHGGEDDRHAEALIEA